jgi:RimJ/RimL family protein N-acetyltransferase
MTGTTFPGCVPELTDGVVRLRAHRAEDADRIVEQSNDPDSMRWIPLPRPYGPEQARDFLATVEAGWNAPHGVRRWAVTDAADPSGRFLGTIDLHPGGGGAAEVGFGLHPDARGSGFMAGAVRLACRWWFGAEGTRVHWLAARGNFASWRVAWACGFSSHGTIPQVTSDPTDPDAPAVDAWRASLGAHDVMEPRTPWDDVPVLDALAGDGIRLRPWRDRDIEALEPRDQPEHYMPSRGVLDADTFPEWLMIRREQMSRGTVLSWCVADATTDAALGEVLVFVTEGTLDDDTAELGYQVVPSARGRGVAGAGARALVAHAFAPRAGGGLGLRRLVAQTADDNAASNAVLDRLGFTIWGRETAADVLPGGRSVDALHWELLHP